MQPLPENVVDAAVTEPCIELARKPPALELLLASKLVESANDILIAMVQRGMSARRIKSSATRHG